MIFDRLETQILGISVDSVFAARAFAKELELTAFPLLGDLGGKVCRTYGVLRGEGFSGGRGPRGHRCGGGGGRGA